MNQPEGKRLLAAVRQGDFAHPGEAEAVFQTWSRLPKRPNQLCLDAGCGRGGTAALVQDQGWGRVTGLDVDGESIEEAKGTYPQIEFIKAAVTEAGERFPGRFDLIYSFNAFYAFPNQPAALRSLRRAAVPDGALCIFDYVDRGGFRESPFARLPESHHWKPLQPDSLPVLLSDSGWQIEAFVELHSDYRRWYDTLVERFAARRSALHEAFDEDLVKYAEAYYTAMRDAVRAGSLGGAVAYARASDMP